MKAETTRGFKNAVQTVLMVVCLSAMTSAVTKPTGCSYSLGVFTCDYRFVIPLDFADFTPQPQRLVLEECSGTFGASDFIGFSAANASAFDINYPAELTIQCQTGGGGLMTLAADSFTDMGFYDNIRIINCEFTAIPANAFANFGTVNYFSFEGGNMDSIDASALSGLIVQKNSALPTPLGEFAMIDVDLVPGGLPTGFFGNQTQASAITISNSRMYTIPLDTFSATTMVTKINLDYNPFTYIPDNIFSSIAALGEVSMAGINWECTCNNLWWRDYFEENGITMRSPSTCTLPTGYYGKTTFNYYSTVCDDGLECDGGKMPAVNLGGVTCLTALQITIYIFSLLGFFGAIAALGIAIHTKRQIGGAGNVGGGGGPKRGASNRIKNAPGSRPPAGTNRPPAGPRKAFN